MAPGRPRLPGRYSVKVSGPVPFARRITLAPAAAPISLTEVELPAELAWSAPGVVVEDRVEGEAAHGAADHPPRREPGGGGAAQGRGGGGGEAPRPQRRADPDPAPPRGPPPHDVVLYEVSRGGLASFTVDLPEGLVVEAVGDRRGGRGRRSSRRGG